MHIKLKFKFIPVVLFLLLLSFESKAQEDKNYLIYYGLINKAEMFEFEKKHEQALTKYMEAFDYAVGFETDFSKAIKITLGSNNHKLTYRFLKERALKTGWFSPEELYDSLQFAQFLKTKFGKKFQQNKEKWFVQNEKSYDLYSYRMINQIDATDQFVREGYLRKYKENFKNDSLYQITKWGVLEDLDNTNFIRFKTFVKNYGFPGRSKLGGKTGYTSAFFKHVFSFGEIYLKKASIFETEKFSYLDSLLKKQVLNGEMDNENFAYCYDYTLSLDSICYYAIPRYEFDDEGKLVLANYPVIDPENLNKRRAEIGLMSIEDQCKIYNAPLPPNYRRKND